MADETKGSKPAPAGDQVKETKGATTSVPMVVTLQVGKRSVAVLSKQVDLRLLGGIKGGRRPALLDALAGEAYDAILGELRELQAS